MQRIIRKLSESIFINGILKSSFIPTSKRYVFYRLFGINANKSSIRENVIFDGTNVSIEENVFINRDVFINCRDKVEIGENSFIAFNVMILTATHEIGNTNMRADTHKRLAVKIGKGCWIDAKATIMPGVTIGDECVMASGAVVNKDCEPNCLYAGVPAKKIRELENETKDN